MASAPLLDELRARDLVHDTTDLDELGARLADGPITLYCGFDPTADSLHVGHLVPLLILRRFQSHGHRSIALAGGGTGMIGDPSGRSAERNLLDAETLAVNLSSITDQLRRLLGDEGGWTLADNLQWLGKVGLLDFLRDVGKHFSVNAMVHKESVRARMEAEEGISFTEFSYMLLQAYDFLTLHDTLGCELQVGGSDQWGNITAGIDLIRRTRGATAYGLTCPLITRSDGRKFGKTEEGTVWLGARRTSPYRFYQYWINVDDRDVARFLRQLTFLSLDEIADIEARAAEAPERRIGQRALAWEMSSLVHGAAAAAAAEEASQVLFGGNVETASAEALEFVAVEVPSSVLPRGRVLFGVDVVELLAETGLAASRSDARRQLAQGAAYVNNIRATESQVVGAADLLHERFVLLRRGKKEYHLVQVG